MTTLVAEANHVEEHEGGIIVVLDRSGDTKHIWDKSNPVEVDAARQLFNTLVTEKRYQAWSVSRKGNKDQRITEFDPQAEKIIFAPALVGG